MIAMAVMSHAKPLHRGALLVWVQVFVSSCCLECLGLSVPSAGPGPEDPPRDDVWAPTDSSKWKKQETSLNADTAAPKRIALAYHGDYHRRAMLSHGAGPGAVFGCSDFFHNADFHQKLVLEPLLRTGATVRTYFHSYNDRACPQRDARLLRALRPARYEFSEEHLPLIVDSYIKVLELVLQDEEDVDAIVLTRFDLRYRAEITEINLDWNKTNVAHREGEKSWKTQGKLSDLFFVLPVTHARPLIRALKESAIRHRNGPGHWFYHPFTSRMGKQAIHIIDEEFAPSTFSPSQTTTFLGISRVCGADFDICPGQ